MHRTVYKFRRLWRSVLRPEHCTGTSVPGNKSAIMIVSLVTFSAYIKTLLQNSKFKYTIILIRVGLCLNGTKSRLSFGILATSIQSDYYTSVEVQMSKTTANLGLNAIISHHWSTCVRFVQHNWNLITYSSQDTQISY
jgi:hypothetical protein